MVSKAERAASAASRTAGRGIGTGIGAAFSSPAGFATIGIIALIALLVIFRKDIGNFFGDLGENFGKIELPTIELPAFPDITFPSFPDITFPDFPAFPEFPELPDFGSIFENFFNQLGGGGGTLPLPPDVEDIGLIEDPATACPCGSTVIQDIQGDVSQVCIPCPDEPFVSGGGQPAPDPFDPDFIGPSQPILPPPDFMLPVPDFPDIFPESFQPPVELPPDFVGGGPSFEGGTIFQTDICNKSIGQIATELGISASAAADRKFQACEVSDFEFGTNTGSGFGPQDDPTGGIVTGGATLESEEKKAACVTCEMFGLNCPICAGTI